MYGDISPPCIRLMDRCSKPVRRTENPTAATIQNMCVNHGCRHILVAQKLLNSSNVIAIFKQARGNAFKPFDQFETLEWFKDP